MSSHGQTPEIHGHVYFEEHVCINEIYFWSQFVV